MRTTLTLLLALASLQLAASAETLTYADLADRLIDLQRLAVLPEPGETCAQWSSYNRASRYDVATGTYVDWSRNGDGHGFIRKEDATLVLAEMQGPGCIWRIWSAGPMDGHVKIYLDGAPEPAVDLPFSGYFNRENPPFIYPSLVYEASSGRNCYVPIPYQKSCKIVAEGRWGAFYHFTYSTFPEGTEVPTLKLPLSPSQCDALQNVDDFLSNQLGANPSPNTESEVVAANLTISPGSSATAANLEGERAVTSLVVKIPASMSLDEAASVLRNTLLRITWDGEDEPAVWAPLGDFFGTVPGINLYTSLPLGMTEDGFYSHWYMPFAKSALVELVNEGDAPIALEIAINHAPLSLPIEKLGRFHAKWHRDASLPTDPERSVDWTLLTTRGRGRYCGVMLHVWNPRGGWWGEGDEKFFVDGEKFPSTFGTGSEDYFGYAWSDPALFHKAYHAETFNRAANRGHISVSRWHIPDNVPFQSSFEGSIEKYFPNDRPTLYAATAYWYLAPAGTDPYQPVPPSQRTGYYDYILPSFPKGTISFDFELLRIMDTSGRSARKVQRPYAGNGQRWRYLLWKGAHPGDRLVFETLPLADAGVYEVTVALAETRRSGTVQFYLDGNELGQPVSTRSQSPRKSVSFPLGTARLAEGQHLLAVEMLDTDPADLALQSITLESIPTIE